MKNPLRVSVISESEFANKSHGVHTAYVELTQALQRRPDVELRVNTSFHEADIIHVHTVGFYALMHLLRAKGRRVISAHVVPASFVGSLMGAKYWAWIMRWYMRLFYNRADIVLAVSDATKSALLEMGVRRPITVFHNVIDTSRYRTPHADKTTLREQLGIPHDAFVVVGNGQVQPRKGVYAFVEVARQHPEMHFVWVGGVPFGRVAAEHNAMMKLMQTQLPNLHFTGVIEPSEVAPYFWAGDVFWLPSTQETFGLAVLEAAAAGLPIVLRDIADYDHTFRPFAVMCNENYFGAELNRLRTDKAAYQQAQVKAGELAAAFDSAAGAERVVRIYRELL